MQRIAAYVQPEESTKLGSFDLVVVGAGILGLAHAWHAAEQGLRVAVVERDERAVGASIRNFGHVCVTAQSGRARAYADASREAWLKLGEASGIDVQEVGTVIVARTAEEESALAEFATLPNVQEQMITGDEVAATLGIPREHSHSIRAGLHLTRDLRVDPLLALDRLTSHLQHLGVRFFFGTNVALIEPGLVRTSRGTLQCTYTVLAVGHDIDRFFPEIADRFEVLRCRLRMLEIDAPRGIKLGPAIFTGLSMLRYDAFRDLKSFHALRSHFEVNSPELLKHDLNHMITQRPDGRLIIGDTHHRSRTETPFEDERSDELVLTETARLFGFESADELRVRKRWRGVYASSTHTSFVCEMPLPGVRAIAVTSGIGMTTSFGFALESLASLLRAGPAG